MRLEHSLLVDVTRQNMERLNEAHCESRKQCIVWGVVAMLLVVWCIVAPWCGVEWNTPPWCLAVGGCAIGWCANGYFLHSFMSLYARWQLVRLINESDSVLDVPKSE